MNRKTLMLPLAALFAIQPATAGTIASASVERTADGALALAWSDQDPVDIFVSDKADATVATAKLVSGKDDDGRYDLPAAGRMRRYFLLRDTKNGGTVRVAERLVPLEQGSNFRDIGGYPAAGGKHVRWGMIYRSGATPLLSDADVKNVQALGLRQIVDLRSNEERVIAPSRLDGIAYSAVGYPMASMSANLGGIGKVQNGGAVYRNFPTMLAPQLRLLFADLLGRDAPIAYNCSAGQDRTGFTTAIVLSALGVPRETIIADYHLSTTYRRPEYEMPKIDPIAQANNPVAMYFAKFQQNPAAAKPKPLKDADGKAFLAFAFDEIETRWGSVDTYLDKEIGVSPADVAKLRAMYLE